ncbi:MAG: abortive infection family protein [Methylococcaceae bacterium]
MYIESDFSQALENTKALLESIGKEICSVKGIDLEPNSKINGVIKQTCSALGYGSKKFEMKISSSLATIGQEIGELRNKIGIISHGRTSEEIKIRNESTDTLTREFLIDSTLVIAVFLIRAFEKEHIPTIKENVDDEELTEFNDFWDGFYGEFEMGDYSFTASEILYGLDSQAYEAEYKNFIGTQDEMEEGEE